MTLLELITYGNNDRLIHNWTWETYEQSNTNAIPESIGESELQFACGKKADGDEPLKGSPEEFAAFYFKVMK